ncbi:MAG: L-aspartate oxidase [Acetivibrionales bacterium]
MPILYDLLKTDVLIIGSGLTGLMSAYFTNVPKNMTVTVLSSGDGASPHVIGFNIPLHKDDSVECFINDTLKGGYYQNDKRLVDALCHDSIELVSILESIGFKFDMDKDQYFLRQPLGATFPRVVGEANNTGRSIMEKLYSKLSKRENVQFLDYHRALRLLVNNSTIRGVLAFDLNKNKFVCIEAKAIVMACGGYCNIYPFSTNPSDISGDGIAMAYYAGLSLIDLEFVQFEPTSVVYPTELRGMGISTTMCHEGAAFRNKDGERFMLKYGPDGEKANKDVLAKLIYEEIQKGNANHRGAVYFDVTGLGPERLRKSYGMFVDKFKTYNVDITKEYIQIAPASHTSLGGIAVSPDCSTSIAGLYACGEIIGGLHGANRIGGNAGLETMVFGRRAGISVSDYIKNTDDPAALSEKQWSDWLEGNEFSIFSTQSKKITGEQMKAIRELMQETISDALNVIREERGLKSASERLLNVIDELNNLGVNDDPHDMFIKLRLHNDLTTAYLLSLSALERKETVGCHIRSDSQPPVGEPYHTKVTKDSNGLVIKKESL